VIFDTVFLVSALWGVFVGAIIPLIIMGILWIITKRQGMGLGDIQLGIVLGAWLGPMRMALTLFSASVLSLLAWIVVSLVEDFDKNRAMPMAPFLAVAGIGVYIGSFYYPEFFHLLIIQ
jgi:leader peptidase (prepilin peptidase)/N-methyltransferase